MSERSAEIQYLLDRAAIEDLLRRYFHGLDRCDPAQVRTCFTDDVRAKYDHRPPVTGIEDMHAKTRRWTAQRWLIDNVIRSVGIDWDQPRSISYNAPCGPEANADFAALRERVRKYADISPAFEATARRREARAQAAEAEEQFVTARQNYFIAAIQYAAAQWPHDENNEKNLALNESRRRCRLRSKASSSRIRAGVSTSASGIPTMAGG